MKPAAALERRIPATMAAVDALCDEIRSRVLSAAPPGERFALELLLREALNNAVMHGARGRPGTPVRCEVKLLAGGARICVFDGGDGFDWRARLESAWIEAGEAPLAESGRGIGILLRYSSRLRFNEKGNCVQATRWFEGEQHG